MQKQAERDEVAIAAAHRVFQPFDEAGQEPITNEHINRLRDVAGI